MTDTPRIMQAGPLPAIPPPHGDVFEIVEAGLDQRAPDEIAAARFMAADAVAERAALADQLQAGDWPALNRYREANAEIHRLELVMIGDSLTEIWGLADPDLFTGRIVNRGISGQTSPQILLRFMADVVDLQPRRVHILCGTNDIAGNTGPNQPEDYQRNIRAMVTLAKAAGIEVLLASLLPADAMPWNAQAEPLKWIPHLNDWLRKLAADEGLTFVDYHVALTDGAGGLQPQFAADGVHVTRAAYRVMRRLLEEALAA